MARVDRTIKRIGGFIIADHQEYGKDQIISRDFYFPHPEHMPPTPSSLPTRRRMPGTTAIPT